METKMVCGVWAQNRKVLVSFITGLSEKDGNVLASDAVIRMPAMPCGHSCTIQGIDDIPLESLPCTCGDPTHWFVKYGD